MFSKIYSSLLPLYAMSSRDCLPVWPLRMCNDALSADYEQTFEELSNSESAKKQGAELRAVAVLYFCRKKKIRI